MMLHIYAKRGQSSMYVENLPASQMTFFLPCQLSAHAPKLLWLLRLLLRFFQVLDK